MKPYLLLTPGPLTTSETVKEAMMTDWCTWDEDYNLGIVQELRNELVNIATKNPEEYTSILLQGSRFRRYYHPERQTFDLQQRSLWRPHGQHCRILSPRLRYAGF